MTSKHTGSCFCGAVRYEALVDATNGSQCNCTACTKHGSTSAIIKPDAFKVTAGEENLSRFSRFPEIAYRYFCKTCGVHLFGKGHLAEVGGDFVSVMLNTLDDIDLVDVTLVHWDGRHDNWQAGPRPTRWRSAGSSDALPGGASA